MSVPDSFCLSQKVCFCHRQSVTVTNGLCLSQTVCVCETQIMMHLFYSALLAGGGSMALAVVVGETRHVTPDT